MVRIGQILIILYMNILFLNNGGGKGGDLLVHLP
jgi:hypothetical protein